MEPSAVCEFTHLQLRAAFDVQMGELMPRERKVGEGCTRT